jgi:hypothetical protein
VQAVRAVSDLAQEARRVNIIRDVFAVIGQGVTLAARQLCPMDHTAARRNEAVRNAHAAVAQCGCGAGYATADLCPWCSEPPDDKPRILNWLGRVEQADGSTWRLSGGDIPRIHPLDGSAIYGWRNDRWSYSYDGGKSWRPTHGSADADLLYPATGEHWVEVVVEDSPRAEGTQRADSSGEVGDVTPDPSPSPERPDVLRQVARQIWLYLDDGNRDRLIVALALIEPPESEGN